MALARSTQRLCSVLNAQFTRRLAHNAPQKDEASPTAFYAAAAVSLTAAGVLLYRGFHNPKIESHDLSTVPRRERPAPKAAPAPEPATVTESVPSTPSTPAPATPAPPPAPANTDASESVPASATPAKPADENEGDNFSAPPAPKTYNVPYLLIGAGTASHFAMRGILERDPATKILIVGNENYRPYARPPLSKDEWFNEPRPDHPDSVLAQGANGQRVEVFFSTPEKFTDADDLATAPGGAVSLLANHMVIDVDPILKRAILDNGIAVYFDKCLIATGGRPRPLKVLEKADPAVRENVLLYRSLDDLLHLKEALTQSKRIAVVGGGFLGSELAVGLAHAGREQGVAVEQIFKEAGILSKILPSYLSEWATKKVQGSGVSVHTGRTIVAAAPAAGNQVALTLDNGETVTADKVVVAVGIQPNIALAQGARLEVDPARGGIVANSELQARSDIYVAGDVANFYDISLGRRREEHHDHAAVTGMLAGANMAGARRPFFNQSIFWGHLGPAVSYEAVGIVDASLPTVAVWAQPSGEDQYGKGVVFYTREKKVVGILCWNVTGSMPMARKIIRSEKAYEHVSELARLFNIY